MIRVLTCARIMNPLMFSMPYLILRNFFNCESSMRVHLIAAHTSDRESLLREHMIVAHAYSCESLSRAYVIAVQYTFLKAANRSVRICDLKAFVCLMHTFSHSVYDGQLYVRSCECDNYPRALSSLLQRYVLYINIRIYSTASPNMLALRNL